MDLGEDELHVAGLTLSGVTRGGVQTSLRAVELGLLFDVGGPIPSQLKHGRVLISHAHQDHLSGLPYFLSQRALQGSGETHIHMPKCTVEPMHRIMAAWGELEGYSPDYVLHGHEPGETVKVGKNLEAIPLRSYHRVPSLAWAVQRHTKKLRPELVGLPHEQIAARRKAGEEITEASTSTLLCVSGDTKIELFDEEPLVRQAKVLVFECTAWDDQRDVEQTRHWGHTHVDEIIERAERFEGEALVLVHRSLRHSRAQAEQIVAQRFPASVRDKVHVFGN